MASTVTEETKVELLREHMDSSHNGFNEDDDFEALQEAHRLEHEHG